MKPNNSLKIIIPLYSILLSIIAGLIFYSNELLDANLKKTEKFPILAYSYEIRFLNTLQNQFEADKSVSEVQIMQSDALKKEIIEKYDISNNELAQNSRLPHLLIVRSHSKNKAEFLKLIQTIRKTSGNILVDYNNEGLDTVYRETEKIKQISEYLIYLVSFLVFLILFYSRIYHERMNDTYWEIYIRAGGSIEQRYHQILIQNIIIYPISVGASVLCYYLLSNSVKKSMVFSPVAVVILAVPALALLISRLLVRRER
jgi:hypothetical protein